MSKQDELQYEQQEKRIQAQSDAFITLLTKRGILGDSRIDDAQKRAARQEKTKNCYHNTLMLLQHYRTLVWMLECFPETVAAELDRPFEGVDKLIEDVDVEVALGNKKIESRMQGMQKSRLLMDRLNEALTVLRKKPDNGERLYINIYWDHDGGKASELLCFAEYNSERDEGAQVCIGTYVSDEDETQYYAPYMAERNNEP